MALPRFHKLDLDKREQLLDAAMEEFAEHGFEQASINRIIERAATSKGSMYYYFEHKEDLFMTVIAYGSEQIAGALELTGLTAHLESPTLSADDFWPQLEALSRRSSQFFLERPVLFRFWRRVMQWFHHEHGTGSMREVLKHHPQLAELMTSHERFFSLIMRRGQAIGAVRDDLPLMLLLQLADSVDGVMDRWLFAQASANDNIEGLEALRCQGIDLFRRIMAPPSALPWTQEEAP